MTALRITKNLLRQVQTDCWLRPLLMIQTTHSSFQQEYFTGQENPNTVPMKIKVHCQHDQSHEDREDDLHLGNPGGEEEEGDTIMNYCLFQSICRHGWYLACSLLNQ